MVMRGKLLKIEYQNNFFFARVFAAPRGESDGNTITTKDVSMTSLAHYLFSTCGWRDIPAKRCNQELGYSSIFDREQLLSSHWDRYQEDMTLFLSR